MPRGHDPAIEPGLGSTSEKLAVLPQEQSFCLESPTKGLHHGSVTEKPGEHA